MIRFEHANLVVSEIAPTLKFLQTAFPDWKVRGTGSNTWGSRERNWLHFGNDNYYITLNDHGEGANRDLAGYTPGLAHLGFVVDNIDPIVERLTREGYAVDTLGRNHPFRRTVYFTEPGGFQFEFMQYLSESPAERNQYGGETGDLIRPNQTEQHT